MRVLLSGKPGAVQIPVIEVLGTVSLSELLTAKPEAGASSTGVAEPLDDATQSVWIVNEERDEITDQPNVYVMGTSELPSFNQFGQSRTITMVFRCQRNTTTAYIIFGDYEVNDYMKVSYRIDGGQAKSESWSVSSDSKAAGLWSGSAAIPFVKRLTNGKKIFVRMRGRSDTHEMEFSLVGLRAHIEKIAKACNWSL